MSTYDGILTFISELNLNQHADNNIGSLSSYNRYSTCI